MRVTLTGATGRIGLSIVEALPRRGDEVTVLTRSPERAREKLPPASRRSRGTRRRGPAPADALAGRDAVVHLAGEDVAQRWNDDVKEEIRASREVGTRNLVEGIAQAEPRPRALVSASASGYYGPHGDEPVDEDTPPGDDFLAEVVVAWEREARRAEDLGLRVVLMRTGVVLSTRRRRAGEDAAAVQARRRRPGRRREAVHALDPPRRRRRACTSRRSTTSAGAARSTSPPPSAVTNKEFSKALGKALHRPAVAPVPGLALKLLYGEMSQIVLTGVNMVPRRAQRARLRVPPPRGATRRCRRRV